MDLLSDRYCAMKPTLTKDDRRYAAQLHKRLVRQYGVGMNSRQLAAELCTTTKNAANTMNHYGFRQFVPKKDNRYSTDDVCALMTLRYHKRKGEIKDRL